MEAAPCSRCGEIQSTGWKVLAWSFSRGLPLSENFYCDDCVQLILPAGTPSLTLVESRSPAQGCSTTVPPSDISDSMLPTPDKSPAR